MKQIIFRPLRKIKKTGKITVASYMQWRKVAVADCNIFNLIVDNEYKTLLQDEFVYNNKGEQLFWFNHGDPSELPKNNISIESILEVTKIDASELSGEEWKFSEPIGKGFHWSIRGFDCDGIPTFSHHTADMATQYKDITQFEPLTVGIVVKWFGWFLYQLKNSKLQYVK